MNSPTSKGLNMPEEQDSLASAKVPDIPSTGETNVASDTLSAGLPAEQARDLKHHNSPQSDTSSSSAEPATPANAAHLETTVATPDAAKAVASSAPNPEAVKVAASNASSPGAVNVAASNAPSPGAAKVAASNAPSPGAAKAAASNAPSQSAAKVAASNAPSPSAVKAAGANSHSQPLKPDAKAVAGDKTTQIDNDMPIRKRRGPSGGYYIECFLREVVTNIRRNPMMSIASISTVMVLAMILGMFVIIIANLESLAQELAGEMQIKVYMADSFEADNAPAFKAEVMKIGHVEKAVFVHKDEAFKRLRERLNAKLDLNDLQENPLPHAFTVPVDDPKFLEPCAHKIAQLSQVATVDYGRDEAKKLMALNRIVRVVGLVILVMLFASTILIVSNTIRLTVFARRKEIDIMQLVGAADWFIRWPFILEGVTQGVLGAALAATIIDVSYRLVVPQIHKSVAFLPILAPTSILPFLNIGLIGLGCIVGAIGSIISVNRYLKA